MANNLEQYCIQRLVAHGELADMLMQMFTREYHHDSKFNGILDILKTDAEYVKRNNTEAKYQLDYVQRIRDVCMLRYMNSQINEDSHERV